jgi:hypothetical protein
MTSIPAGPVFSTVLFGYARVSAADQTDRSAAHPEQQAKPVLCLAIVCNTIIVWITVYIQRVLDQLQADGS